jgi:hypothetical protein
VLIRNGTERDSLKALKSRDQKEMSEAGIQLGPSGEELESPAIYDKRDEKPNRLGEHDVKTDRDTQSPNETRYTTNLRPGMQWAHPPGPSPVGYLFAIATMGRSAYLRCMETPTVQGCAQRPSEVSCLV